MRITIIEMSVEEFASLGNVEEVTDLVAAAESREDSSTCHGGAPQRRNAVDGNFLGNVKAFGQELWGNGDATLRDLVTLTIEHFGLSTADFARIIGANRSTVSRYINHGQCREAVLLACTIFFGCEGSPESTQCPAEPGEQSQTTATATAIFGGKII